MMEQTGFDYILYGTRAKAREVEAFLQHVFSMNEAAENMGQRKTPVCIWGFHGIGKTELVEAFARRNGFEMAYMAPAQFEEMGDLIGMPAIADGKTKFAPPEWVPDSPGPGILLIDDLNRADDRILRGLMQLFQMSRLASWELPAGWHIVATANPDGGDYSVTPLDDAMITRMMHITMEFDLHEWAIWAEKQDIDPRGIQFALTCPGKLTGTRTTPRTLVQFFEAIKRLDNLYDNAGIVQSVGEACLDESTVSAFWNFVENDLNNIVTPQEILDTGDFENEVRLKLVKDKHQLALNQEQLFVLTTRLCNLLEIRDEKLEKKQIDNLRKFVLLPDFPHDLRFGFTRKLSELNRPSINQIFDDPAIGKFLLSAL